VNTSIEDTLSKAAEHEKRYEWLEAAKLIENALRNLDKEDYFRRAQIQERMGYSLHRAAFQNDQKQEFIDGLGRAVDAYRIAQGLFEEIPGDQGAPWILRCKAFSKYLEHWTVPDAPEKLRLLQESQTLRRQALESFWASNQKHEYCKTYTQLDRVTLLRFIREWDPEARDESLKKTVSSGEKAIEALPEINDPNIAAEVNVVYIRNLGWYWNFVEPQGKSRLFVITSTRL